MKLSVENTGHPSSPLEATEEVDVNRASRLRRLARVAAFLLAALCLLAALLPRILSMPVCHRLVTGRMAREVAGHLDVGRLHLRWLTPPVIEDLRFAAPDDQPVLELSRCRVTRSLWSFLCDSSTFGELRLEQPTFYLLLNGSTSNLSEAIKPTRVDEVPAKALRFVESIEHPAAGKIIVHNGRFVFQSAPRRDPVELLPFGVSATIHPRTTRAGPVVTIEPCQLADGIVLSRPLCNDLLKYVAPVLADATWVQGAFSAQVDAGTFPLDDVQHSKLRGRITIHQIAAGPGPIISEIAKRIGTPDAIQLVDESQIEFQMSDRSIRHSGLRFQLGRFAVETSGTVGLDESMQLAVDIHFPPEDASGSELGERLAGRILTLPITGTLSQPRIDWRQLAEHHPLLDEWIANRLQHPEQTPVLDALRQFRRGNATVDPAPSPRPILRRLFPGVMRTLDAGGVSISPSPSEPLPLPAAEPADPSDPPT